MAQKCSVCGAKLDDDSKFCVFCGAKAQAETQPHGSFCIHCGAKLGEGERFCGSGGAPTGPAPRVKTPKAPRKPKSERKKINIGPILINALLIGVCIALIIIGINLIPDNIRDAGLPYVPVEKNEIDGEVQAEYDTVRSGGSLFDDADEDASERSHVYYPVFDAEEDAE